MATIPPSTPLFALLSDAQLVGTLSAGPLSAQQIGQLFYAQSTAEQNANVTPSNYVYPPGNILRYGADPTGANDSTSAFVQAGSIGQLIYAPSGTYKVTSNITITGGGIIGDGAYLTYINTTDTTSANIFVYTGNNAGRFENFQLQTNTGAGQKSGGYGIVINPSTGETSNMRISQIVMNNLPQDIFFQRASLWSMVNSNFYNFTSASIQVDNQNNADSGDSSISGCIWTSVGNASAIGIQQVSSGGLKIANSKFNNLQVGYLLNLSNGGSTSDLLLANCSFENCANSCVQLQRQGGATTSFYNVNITGCEFYIASASGAGVYSVDSSGFLSSVSIVANTFKVAGTSGAACVFLDYVTAGLVADNVMAGAGGTSYGVLTGTHNTNLRVGINQISGFSASVDPGVGTIVTKSDIQTGTVSITTSTAYSGLFAGTANVTFPTAFQVTVPTSVEDGQVYPANTSAGGIAAFITAYSNTGMTIEAIGINNAGSVSVNWRAVGVI
jgi:hypothetical protein